MSLSKPTGDKDEIRVLVIGKTGSGKSDFCNRILLEDRFQMYYGMSGKTTTAQFEETELEDSVLKVVDTPDIVNLNMSQRGQKKEIARWLELVTPYPHVILLVVRGDIRYKEDDFEYYKKMRECLGDSLQRMTGLRFTDRLIVGFTRSENIVPEPELDSGAVERKVQQAGPDFIRVFTEADGRFVLIPSKKDGNTSQKIVMKLKYLKNRIETVPMQESVDDEEDQTSRSICNSLCILSIIFALYAFLRFDSAWM